jgi:hypothetical protein
MLKAVLTTAALIGFGLSSAVADACSGSKAAQVSVPPVAAADPVQTPLPADTKKELAEADIKTPAAPKTN